ncbi:MULTISPECIES: response regulator transcription factor [Pantoea]|jgi:two-component system, NarL family, captular synthesis response regulator RcsB|uniref:response regulator transcription factor n=1 Tax=Pantoea TaxID=53335 RepID=UPI000CE2BE90|nr:MULTISPECIES: response regulator transcription factor [Pantoea]MBS0896886.1 response regulator transcription factor [Pantoea dispersa]MDI6635020.1 response regulator transcription factor [Pantoea dispersa]PPC69924.1 DNA-binding response regulator [Pantoea sp. ICBG 985]THD38141.1 response regulator transcription factor [Pantoea sp. R102]UXO67916.1 response regulator transcription factor [Pantoea dispersa]
MKESAIWQIAVLDDHPLIGKAMQYRLAQEPQLDLAGAFAQRQQLMTFLQRQPIDILVLDYMLGEDQLDGLQMVKQLRLHYPQLKILVSSAVEKPAIVQLLLKAGVQGFVGKSHDQEVLIDAIHQICRGKRFLTPDMMLELDKFQESDREMHDYLTPRQAGDDITLMLRELSPREIEVIRCYLDGLSITQIAGKYARSRKTISGQKQTALRKLGLRSDLELFKYKQYFNQLVTAQ